MKGSLGSVSFMALSVALMPVASASAQTAQTTPQAASDADDMAPGEIVVTAQKRAERLVDVPVTVTAVSADVLRQRQINDTRSLTDAVPSLTFTEGGKAANNSFRIRGVGTALFNFGAESSVSTVIDGVVLGRGAQGFSELSDVERIEVLEGPQGTLFGKNADAGLINVVTARPSHQLSANGEVTVAEGEEYRAKGTISGPLSDTLRASISGNYSYVGGNLFSSVSPGDRIGTVKSRGVRGKLDWDMTENLNWLAIASYYKTQSGCCSSVIQQFDNSVQIAALVVPFTANTENRLVQMYKPSFDDSRQFIGSLEGNLKLGDFTITSITSYQNYRFDANPFPVIPDALPPLYVAATPQLVTPYGSTTQTTINGAGGRSKTLSAGGPGSVTQFAQEIRVTSPGTGPLTYVAGLYYQTQKVGREYLQRWGTCPVTAGNTVGLPCGTSTTVLPIYVSNTLNAGQTSDQIAVFGQGEYKLTDKLSVLAGVRVQRETVSYFVIRPGASQPGDVSTLSVGSGSGNTADNTITGKLGLQYHVNRNAQFYATYARGYKGASYDIELTAAFNQTTPVLPETVNAFEAGFKGRIFGGRALLTAAAFYAKYKNLQVQAQAVDPLTFTATSIPTNAGDVTTKGFQAAISAEVTQGLSVNASVVYSKATVNANGLPCTFPQNNAAVYGLPAIATVAVGAAQPSNVCFRQLNTSGGSATFQNVRNGSLPGAPEWRGNASIRYEHPLFGSLAGFIMGSMNFQSWQSFDLSQDPFLSQPGYATFDLNFGVKDIDNKYSLTVFVKNLTNRHYYTGKNYAGNNVRPAGYVLNYDQQGYNVNLPKAADRYVGATFAFKF
ncbi:TonB-dependent receptor [Novosphingobium flavum]|uniref:TonB-dependent receptor n=1 Tax=Novosphingobium flavum TaxID=1778672 RepID=A0A7X1FTJ0_9SPHN|nr:TonB-dependent receptor [Novosphingobium flavum]MBC2666724.1 TonB-dependent receptor [Novosphingobium flavum]